MDVGKKKYCLKRLLWSIRGPIHKIDNIKAEAEIIIAKNKITGKTIKINECNVQHLS